MTTDSADSAPWPVLIADGRWADLVTDAVRSHDRSVVADAAALIQVDAPIEIRDVLLRRLRQVVSGQWERMIAEAAVVDVHDTPRLIEQLQRALAALDHVQALITVGAPPSQQDRLTRRAELARAPHHKALDREVRHATGSTVTPAAPAVPTRPAAAQSAPRPAAPTSPDTPGAPADAAVVDSAVELARWEREVVDAVAKTNKRRAELDRPPIELSEQLIAEALAEWHGALIVEGDALHFVSTPSWTGLCLARWLCKRYPVIPTPTAVPPESVIWQLPQRRGCRLMRVINFFDLDVPLAAGDVLVEVDVNAQHLAAARGAELGDGEPTHVLDADGVTAWITAAWAREAKLGTRPRELTADGLYIGMRQLVRRPGYVILAAAPNLSTLPPHARLVFAKAGTGTILPMPLAAYLVLDHKITLDVAEAIFWDTRPETDPRTGKETQQRAYGRRLEKWATVITEGRARLMDRAGSDPAHPAALALQVLKAMYAQFTGAFLRSVDTNIDRETGEPTPWLRPDWYDQLVGRASANMLRALDKAHPHGLAAVAGLKDAVWAVVPRPLGGATPATPAAPAGLDESRQSGRWKINRWAVVDDEILDGHARSRVVPLREALAAADTERIRAGETA